MSVLFRSDLHSSGHQRSQTGVELLTVKLCEATPHILGIRAGFRRLVTQSSASNFVLNAVHSYSARMHGKMYIPKRGSKDGQRPGYAVDPRRQVFLHAQERGHIHATPVDHDRAACLRQEQLLKNLFRHLMPARRFHHPIMLLFAK